MGRALLHSALVLQGGALPHSEAVLLIGDAQAQALIFHAFADEGVGTKNRLPLAALKTPSGLALFLRPHGARQQSATDAQGLQHGAGGFIVLPGQYLRRGHHGRLIPCAAYQGDGPEGQGCFAAAHIALHQAAHGPSFSQISGDFLQNPPLRPRGRKGHGTPIRLGGILRKGQGKAVLLLPPKHGKRRLIHQHLLKGQAAARPPQAIHAVGKMRLPNGKIPLAQSIAQPQGARQRFGAAIVHLGERRLHHLAEGLGRDALHPAIHRLDGGLRHTLGILKRAAAVLFHHAAIEHHRFPHGQLLAHPGLIIPHHGQAAAVIMQGGRHTGQPGEAVQLRRVPHLAHDQYLAAPGFPAGGDARPVLIADGQTA